MDSMDSSCHLDKGSLSGLYVTVHANTAYVFRPDQACPPQYLKKDTVAKCFDIRRIKPVKINFLTLLYATIHIKSEIVLTNMDLDSQVVICHTPKQPIQSN